MAAKKTESKKTTTAKTTKGSEKTAASGAKE
jgi:hypothetical protein